MALTPYPVLGDLTLDGVEASGVEWRSNPVLGWAGPPTTIAQGKKPRGHGAWVGTSYFDPRHVVLSGSVWAPTEELLEDAIDRLNVAAALTDTMLTVHTAAGSKWATVRREGEVLAPLTTPTFAEWSVQLFAPDPRKFGAELTATTSLPSSTGGLTVPFTVPFTIDAVTASGQVSLTNPGNVTGPVRLRIDGPVVGPVVTHVGSGLALVFSTSLDLAAGEFVTVDLERHEVLAQGQTSRNGWVTGRGWFGFEAGVNTFSFSAVSGSGTLQVWGTESWE